ncbi:MAG TPA: hypothetical protein VG754_05205 [Verrucomicrobiae bacterium]|jgi:hypothetical protein|nr:hypothetical protein [Verrucomicrobiae bacterium]
MKRKKIIVASCMALIIGLAIAIWWEKFGGQPTLVFKGYDKLNYSSDLLRAKLELRNTTKQPIWFLYCGQRHALESEFMQRCFLSGIIGRTNRFDSMLYIEPSENSGGCSARLAKLMPNESCMLEWTLSPRSSQKHLGICYYYGDFKDNSDFLSNCWVQPLFTNASFKEKIEFYCKKEFRSQRVVYCPEPFSYEEGASTLRP